MTYPTLLRPGSRGLVLFTALLGGVLASLYLDLSLSELLPNRGGLEVMLKFVSAALHPAWSYEATSVPHTAAPLWLKALDAGLVTAHFAAAATSLAFVLGLLLSFPASTSWWARGATTNPGLKRHKLAVSFGVLVWSATRLLAAFLRSIHELLWAVLLLAAFGLGHLSAVIAIALPFTGTFAKVFSEILDETPRSPAQALREAGAGPLQAYLFGVLPLAWKDITAYALYRFECALRSAAVLGFFGFPTLGYFVAASFENLHYREVWTYVYVLVIMVVVVDWWSGALRRRLEA